MEELLRDSEKYEAREREKENIERDTRKKARTREIEKVREDWARAEIQKRGGVKSRRIL